MIRISEGVIQMDLTFTDDVKERIARYLSPDKRIILDYDDGVGPFSKVGNCSLAANYKLIFIAKDVVLPDFDAHFPSNLGDVYYKGFDAPQYSAGMELRFNPTYFTMALTSPQGVLTDSVEILDVTETVDTVVRQVTTHDC